jgi:hypothetical protein
MAKRKQGFSITTEASRRLHALAFALGVPKSQIVESGIDTVLATLTSKQRAAYDAACAAVGGETASRGAA